MHLKGEVLIVGLGQSGLSAARALHARGVEFAVADSRWEPPGLAALHELRPQTTLYLGTFDPAVFARMDTLILSPGVSVYEPAVQAALAQGTEVIGDIELFARLAQAPVVAITGSNGKSTVTSVLGVMAQAAGVRVAVGGNLGPPALNILNEHTQLYVLELSSFQLETTTSLNAQAACVLNISPDHLDRYPHLHAYIAAKQKIFQGNGIQVLNRDDPAVVVLAEAERRQCWFTLSDPGVGDFGIRLQQGDTWLAYGEELWLNTRELRIKGAHNWANTLAAFALGHSVGLSREAMVRAAVAFSGLPHRCQWLAEVNGVCWYDDSKGTNVGATLAAVQGLPGKVVLIAGGDGKGQDFSPLAVLRDKLRGLVLIGRDAPMIAAAMGREVVQHYVADMPEAVAQAAALAQSGDSVLLSPACASFDLFTDYQARGRAFAAAVRDYLPC